MEIPVSKEAKKQGRNVFLWSSQICIISMSSFPEFQVDSTMLTQIVRLAVISPFTYDGEEYVSLVQDYVLFTTKLEPLGARSSFAPLP
jgi:hypothetical protein